MNIHENPFRVFLLFYLWALFQMPTGLCQQVDAYRSDSASPDSQKHYTPQGIYSDTDNSEQFAFDRGTASIVDGEAEIYFSNRFQLMANPSSISLGISVWDIDPKQLVILEITSYGFKIKDLKATNGSRHQFEWEAKAICKGFESTPLIQEVQIDPTSSIK